MKTIKCIWYSFAAWLYERWWKSIERDIEG